MSGVFRGSGRRSRRYGRGKSVEKSRPVRMSMTRFSHRSWMTVKTAVLTSPIKVEMMVMTAAVILRVNWNCRQIVSRKVKGECHDLDCKLDYQGNSPGNTSLPIR